MNITEACRDSWMERVDASEEVHPDYAGGFGAFWILREARKPAVVLEAERAWRILQVERNPFSDAARHERWNACRKSLEPLGRELVKSEFQAGFNAAAEKWNSLPPPPPPTLTPAVREQWNLR